MDYNRFSSEAGCHYSPAYLLPLTDEELAKAIRDIDYWDHDLLRELVLRADKIEPGLLKRYEEEEEFEPIIEKAADILNVKIY